MIGRLIDLFLDWIGLLVTYECPLCLRESARWLHDEEVCSSCSRALKHLEAGDADRRLAERIKAARSARDSSSSDSSCEAM